MNAAPAMVTLHLKAARLPAVELLPAEPEALGHNLGQRLCQLHDNLREGSR